MTDTFDHDDDAFWRGLADFAKEIATFAGVPQLSTRIETARADAWLQHALSRDLRYCERVLAADRDSARFAATARAYADALKAMAAA